MTAQAISQAKLCWAGCGQEGSRLLTCSRCVTAIYCSKPCQIAHWKQGGHRAECLTLKGRIEVVSDKPVLDNKEEAPSSEGGQDADNKEGADESTGSRGPEAHSHKKRKKTPCAQCEKTVKKVQKCAHCLTAAYCSSQCQKEAWPKHKLECLGLNQQKIEELQASQDDKEKSKEAIAKMAKERNDLILKKTQKIVRQWGKKPVTSFKLLALANNPLGALTNGLTALAGVVVAQRNIDKDGRKIKALKEVQEREKAKRENLQPTVSEVD